MSVIETKLIGRGISAGSLKLYEGNLKRLNNSIEPKTLTYLKNTTKILDQIKNEIEDLIKCIKMLKT